MSSLQNFSGTLVLVGAGKMGGAMLDGWLALAKAWGRVPHDPAHRLGLC